MSDPKIYIAGHLGMVGSSILRNLKKKKQKKIIVKKRSELDLFNQKAVFNFFKKEKIDQVYIAAARAGGIYANATYPAEFIYENLTIQTNVIHSAFLNNVKKVLFLGSSCIYPKFAKQPMSESALLSGYLEPTNEPYAIAKIAGIKFCESYNRQYGKSHGVDYRSLMPTNLYGPGDNYHSENSHVIPGLLRRFHEAKIKSKPKVIVWGTGRVRREFLHVDDLADAATYVMNLKKNIYIKNTKPMLNFINVGSGWDLSIKELAKIIKEIVGYNGLIEFDIKKPDGVPRKLLDSTCLNKIGWKSKIDLRVGLDKTYKDFKNLYEKYQ
jgi:GDP-L-fucose synthase